MKETVKSKNSYSKLHQAAFWDCPKIIESLLKKGFNINSEDENGKTPLQYAVSHASVEAARCLIEKGADIKRKDRFGISPFSLVKKLKDQGTIRKRYGEIYLLMKNKAR